MRTKPVEATSKLRAIDEALVASAGAEGSSIERRSFTAAIARLPTPCIRLFRNFWA